MERTCRKQCEEAELAVTTVSTPTVADAFSDPNRVGTMGDPSKVSDRERSQSRRDQCRLEGRVSKWEGEGTPWRGLLLSRRFYDDQHGRQ